MKSKYIQIILAAVVSTVLTASILLLSNGGVMSSWALDTLWHLNGPLKMIVNGVETTNDQVAIVAIDNKTLRNYRAKNASRISRTVYAEIINKLSNMGARVIAFDVTFDKPGNKQEDQSLINAVKNFKNIVTNCYLKNDKNFNKLWIEGRAFFHKYVKAEGLADLPVDNDNFIRRIRLYAAKGNLPCRVAFALAIYLTSINSDASKIVYKKTSIQIPRPGFLPKLNLPLSYNGLALIGFLGGPGTIPTYSAVDILNNKINAKLIRDKIVLIGGTADEFRDVFHTPFAINGRMPGVEIHAHLLENLFMGKLPHEINGPYYWLTLCFIAALIAILVFYFSPVKILPVLIIISILWLPVVIWLFVKEAVFINMFDVWVCLFIAWVSSTTIREYFLQNEKQAISKLFHQYVSPNLLNELMENPETIALGGAKKQAVVLFADVRGFTSLCEERSPEEIIQFLNIYFDAVSKEIFNQGGILNKYMGDGLMAFFGVPILRGNEAWCAVEAAVNMRKTVTELKEKYKNNFPIEKIGVGIHGGEVVVGNVGSEKHMEYTLLGDTVNVAARLESLAKNGQILISKWIYERLPKSGFKVMPCGNLKVKGRKHEVETYEVLN